MRPAHTYIALVALPSCAALEPEDSPSHDDTFFLGWVRLYLLGCTPLEVRDAVRASCESGAIREPELHRDTTHILVRGRRRDGGSGSVERDGSCVHGAIEYFRTGKDSSFTLVLIL